MIEFIMALNLIVLIPVAIVVLGFLTYLTEKEYTGLTLLILFTLLSAYLFFSDINVWSFLTNHIGTIILGLFGYVIAGIFWSLFKWYLLVLNVKEKYNASVAMYDSLSEIEKKHNNKELFIKLRIGINYPIKVDHHKNKIYNWLILWPTSLIWFLINDPITRLYNYLYKTLKGTYQKIADNQFENINPE
jgi:hypothetical protein